MLHQQWLSDGLLLIEFTAFPSCLTFPFSMHRGTSTRWNLEMAYFLHSHLLALPTPAEEALRDTKPFCGLLCESSHRGE